MCYIINRQIYTYNSDNALDWKAHYGYTYLRDLLNDKGWKQSVETEGYAPS